MILIERIITPEGFNPDANLTSEGHKLAICREEYTEKFYKAKNDGTYKEPDYELKETTILDSDVEIGAVSCTCGQSFDSKEEGLEHLKNVEKQDKGRLKQKTARKQLSGVKLHEFEFVGLDAHGGSIRFAHEELGLEIYATPNWSEQGKISVAVEGTHDTIVLGPLDGSAIKELEASEHLTVAEYLQHLRDFIEQELLSKSRRKELGLKEEQ